MPKRKDKPPELVTIKVSIPVRLKAECQEAREAGLRKGDAESTFIRYLLELGLKRYQKVILPEEISAPDAETLKWDDSDVVWVNKDLKAYDFSVTNGTPTEDAWKRAKAEELGYEMMSVHEYKEEYFQKHRTEPPPPQRPKYVLGKGVWDGEPA